MQIQGFGYGVMSLENYGWKIQMALCGTVWSMNGWGVGTRDLNITVSIPIMTLGKSLTLIAASFERDVKLRFLEQYLARASKRPHTATEKCPV
jgi:hypothetical protein